MTVRYTATAHAETDDILARIAKDNPDAAVAVGAAIRAAVAQLSSFPRMGTETDEPGIYLRIARPYRYLIFYRVEHEKIVIRNIRHPARRRPF
jgi:plasmid stabilization system protein ParE